MAEDEYARHLTDLHSRLNISEDVLLGAVQEVTRAEITSRKRIIGGEANEVWDMAFSDNRKLIIRISRDAEKHFEQEQWAIAHCVALDVPVPKILLIKHLSTPDRPLDICIQEKLDGDVLTQGANDLKKIPQSRLEAITKQLGEFLSKIHSIPVEGFGYLDGNGQGGAPTTWASLGDQEEQYLDLARKTGFDQGAMKAILTVLKEKEYPIVQLSCVHNDFRARHVMVHEDRITGIIDWGEVAGGDPMSDFAKWDYKDVERIPLEWLKAGYQNKALLADYFEERLYHRRLEFGLCIFWWYNYQGFPAGVEEAKTKLLQDLAFF